MGQAGVIAVCVIAWAPLAACAAVSQTDAPAAQMLREARPGAIDVLLTAARGDDPFLRANAIEAMIHAPDRVLPLAELGLRDPHPAVRFAALVTIGRLGAPSMVRVAEQMTGDAHPSVRAAAYYAARRCGSPINVSPLGQMLFDPDPDVRANTAMLLGLMGEKSAAQMLAEAAARPMPRAADVKVLLVRAQIAEARVRLGEYEMLDAIRAGAFSVSPEVRMACIGMLGELGDVKNMEDALFTAYNDPQEVLELRLATAAALVRHGRRVAVKEVLDGLATVLSAAQMGEPTFRAQAAVTLGAIEEARARVRPMLVPGDPPDIVRQFTDTAATAALIGLLADPDGRVRVSAAAGVVRATER